MNMKLLPLLGFVGASLVGAQGTLADDHKWEATALIGKYRYDSHRDIDRADTLSLGVGYVLNKDWTLEAMATEQDAEFDGSDIDVDGRHYRLDALYHFLGNEKWSPFVVMGIGDLKLDPDTAGSSSTRETLLNLGLGLKYKLSDSWQLRGDIRALNSIDEEETDGAINLGVSYLFGASSSPQKQKSSPMAAAPVDSDGDGVYDSEDRCPETGMNLKVDSNGCPQTLSETVGIELSVNFDTNSAEVKASYNDEIKRAADFMAQYLDTVVTVEGHTDDRGAASYNESLSQRRADAVRQVLIDDFGIAADRVKAKGYGQSRPSADNSTAEGREANRRVVAQVSSEVERDITK